MPAHILPADNPAHITRAAGLIRSGRLVAAPTDTVYGLTAALDQPQALQRIYAVKGRIPEKALPTLIGQLDHLPQIAGELPPIARKLAAHFWPGGLTLVVPKHPGLSPLISPYPTVGVRMPNNPAMLALLRQTGPLAVTSANLSSGPDSCTAADVFAQIGDQIDLILDGGPTPGPLPSTVLDCTTPTPTLLRQGPVTLDEIRAILNH